MVNRDFRCDVEHLFEPDWNWCSRPWNRGCVCRRNRVGLLNPLASDILRPQVTGIQSSGSRLSAAPSIRKIGRKLAAGGAPPAIVSFFFSRLQLALPEF